MEENMILMRDSKPFRCSFDWPKKVDKNLKHETEFIIKSNASLSENKIKTEIKQLLPKYNIVSIKYS